MAAVTQSTGHLLDVALDLAEGQAWGLTEEQYELGELVFFFIYLLDVLCRFAVLRNERHG